MILLQSLVELSASLLGVTHGRPAQAGPMPPPIIAPLGSQVSQGSDRSERARRDAVAVRAYAIEDKSDYLDDRRFLKLPQASPQTVCNRGYHCSAISIDVPIVRPDVLARHSTRLTLNFTISQTSTPEFAVRLGANAAHKTDWIRAGAKVGAMRQLILDIPPALALASPPKPQESEPKLRIEIRVAVPPSCATTACHKLRGLELELLP